jgi:hypothetical protein
VTQSLYVMISESFQYLTSFVNCFEAPINCITDGMWFNPLVKKWRRMHELGKTFFKSSIYLYNKVHQHTSLYNKVHQHTSLYNKVHQHTSLYNKVHQHTNLYNKVHQQNSLSQSNPVKKLSPCLFQVNSIMFSHLRPGLPSHFLFPLFRSKCFITTQQSN